MFVLQSNQRRLHQLTLGRLQRGLIIRPTKAAGFPQDCTMCHTMVAGWRTSVPHACRWCPVLPGTELRGQYVQMPAPTTFVDYFFPPVFFLPYGFLGLSFGPPTSKNFPCLARLGEKFSAVQFKRALATFFAHHSGCGGEWGESFGVHSVTPFNHATTYS